MYKVYIIIVLIILTLMYLNSSNNLNEPFADTTVSYTDADKNKILQVLKDTYEVDALLNIAQIAKGLQTDGYTVPGKLNVSGDLVGKNIYQNNYLLVPIGTVLQYVGTTAPNGYLLCDGTNVSRTTYANLYDVIKTSFGSGDGSTTFTLPDFKGRTPIGVGKGTNLSDRVMGTKGGAETHTLIINEMPLHNHSINDPGHTHYTSEKYSIYDRGGNKNTETGGDGKQAEGINNMSSSNTGISINNTGGNQPHNNMQPFTVINFIIKY